MTITFELPDGRRIQVQRDSATLGRGPGADIVVASADVQPIHATIHKVAGRWMVESAGDWLLQVGTAVPGRKLWLQSGEALHLTQSGAALIFEPKTPPPSVPPPEQADSLPQLSPPEDLDTGGLDRTAEGSTPLPPPLPQRFAPWSDETPRLLPPETVLQQPAPRANVARTPIQFRGRGTIIIGRGTVTFTGKHNLRTGELRADSLMIPWRNIKGAHVENRDVCVWFQSGNIAKKVTFGAENADDAKWIAATLEGSDPGGTQQEGTEAKAAPARSSGESRRRFPIFYRAEPEQDVAQAGSLCYGSLSGEAAPAVSPLRCGWTTTPSSSRRRK